MAAVAGIEEGVFRAAWAERWLDRELGLASLEECIAQVLGGLTALVSTDVVASLRDIWVGPVRDHLNAGAREDVGALLRRSRTAGLKIGLVSNAGPEVPGVVRAGPLSELFDVAVFSCTVGVAKPDRDIYLAACCGLGVSPGECLYVGDGGDHELQGAREVGMTPILLRVEDEIATEGIPDGAAAWDGQVISTFDELWGRLGLH